MGRGKVTYKQKNIRFTSLAQQGIEFKEITNKTNG